SSASATAAARAPAPMYTNDRCNAFISRSRNIDALYRGWRLAHRRRPVRQRKPTTQVRRGPAHAVQSWIDDARLVILDSTDDATRELLRISRRCEASDQPTATVIGACARFQR